MSDINKVGSFNYQLTGSVAPSNMFGVALYLVDTVDVPIHRKYKIVTKNSYVSDLPTQGDDYSFALQHFTTGNLVESLIIAKWARTAQASYFYIPTGSWNADFSDYTASDYTFSITDGTSTVDLSVDATSVTTMTALLGAMQTVIRAASGTIAALATATLTMNTYGDLVLTNSVTGASAADLIIEATDPAVGTDMTGASLLNAGAGVSVSGMDAENPETALQRVLDVYDSNYWVVIEHNASSDNIQSLALYVNTLQKQFVVVIREAGAKSSVSVSDTAYLLNELNYSRTMGIYTEHAASSSGLVDADVLGKSIWKYPGSVDLAKVALEGVKVSGKDSVTGAAISLTPPETSALDGKNTNYLLQVQDSVFMHKSLTYGGKESRVIWGLDYAMYLCQLEWFNYCLQADVVAFDDETTASIQGILERNFKKLEDRRLISSYKISLQDPRDLTSTEKAERVYRNTSAFTVEVNTAFYELVLSGFAEA